MISHLFNLSFLMLNLDNPVGSSIIFSTQIDSDVDLLNKLSKKSERRLRDGGVTNPSDFSFNCPRTRQTLWSRGSFPLRMFSRFIQSFELSSVIKRSSKYWCIMCWSGALGFAFLPYDRLLQHITEGCLNSKLPTDTSEVREVIPKLHFPGLLVLICR